MTKRVRTREGLLPGPGCVWGVAIVVLALAACLLTRRLWLPAVGRALVVADPLPAAADAVVPLAGGDERSVYAARLFVAGHAAWYVAANMDLNLPGVRASYAELVRQEAVWQGVPAERVVLVPGTVATTCQEAEAVAGLARERGWRSLLVVTDPYHTRRARLCFRQALEGSGIGVAVRPVEPSWYDPESWWRTVDGQRDTWTEYLKLALHAAGYR